MNRKQVTHVECLWLVGAPLAEALSVVRGRDERAKVERMYAWLDRKFASACFVEGCPVVGDFQ